MIKNSSQLTTIDKYILAIFLALLASLLSTVFINSANAADVVPNEIQMPGTQPE